MDKQEIIKKIHQASENTLNSNLGIEITDIGRDFVCGKMPVDERTIQRFGILHGGASAAFAETLGSIASTMQIDLKTERAVGVEINANHLKSVKSGWVYGEASPVRIGRKIQVWNIEIKNEAEELICVSRLTMAVIKRK